MGFHLLKDIWKLGHPPSYFQSLQLKAKKCTPALVCYYYFFLYYSFLDQLCNSSNRVQPLHLFCLFLFFWFFFLIISRLSLILFHTIQFGFSGVLWVNCQEKLLRVCPRRKCQCECVCTIYNNKVLTLHFDSYHMCVCVCVCMYVCPLVSGLDVTFTKRTELLIFINDKMKQLLSR